MPRYPEFQSRQNGYVIARLPETVRVGWVKYEFVCTTCGNQSTKLSRVREFPSVPERCDHSGCLVEEMGRMDAFFACLRASHLSITKAALKTSVKDYSLVHFPAFFNAIMEVWEGELEGFRPDPSSVHLKDPASGMSKNNLGTKEGSAWPTKEELLECSRRVSSPAEE